MWTPALAGTQRWPIGSESVLTLAWPLCLSRNGGTRPLKDRLAALRHSATRRRSRSRLRERRWRRSIHRTRSGLRNDHSAHRRRGSVRMCSWLRGSWSHGRRRSRRDNVAAWGVTYSWGYYWGLHHRDFNSRLFRFGLRLKCHANLLVGPMFDQFGRFRGRRGRRCQCDWRYCCRCFRGNGHRGRRTCHRLRRDKSWNRFGRLNGGDRHRRRNDCRWLDYAARRTRWHCRRWGHGLS